MSAEFRRELIALLEKYNASIGFMADDCSDFHGITGERIVVADSFHQRDILVSTHGLWMDANDIRAEYPEDTKGKT